MDNMDHDLCKLIIGTGDGVKFFQSEFINLTRRFITKNV